MFSWAQLRRLGPVLLGFVLLAQAAGIVPLMSMYVQHAVETEQDVAADLANGGRVAHVHHHHAHRDGAQHEHGATDPNDQCCTLHHLIGVLPKASGALRSGLTRSIVAVPPRSLFSTEPGTLERPPKSLLSI
jgi:ABC-type Zn2+ transport system substrate-binding protein/surface adhesin